MRKQQRPHLKEHEIWQIWKECEAGIKTIKEIAYDHNLNLSTVYNIRNKKAYRDIIAYNIMTEKKFREASQARKNETEKYNG